MTTEISTWFHPAFIFFVVGLGLAVFAWRRYSFRRGMQVFSLNLFITFFWMAAFGGKPAWPVDFFLFSNPLIAIVTTLASRVLVPILLVSIVFVVLAVIMGRIFCSHICPMGVMLDFSDRYIGRRQRAKGNRLEYKRARKVKYIFLLVILAAALVGFNLLGFGDPIVLFTRFSATLFYPAVMVLQDVGLLVLRPLGAWAGWIDVAYLELIMMSFDGAIITLGLLIVLLVLARLQPRFWCRHLCPLGGLLGWIGKWAPYRRRVNDDCNSCNTCVRECPTGAIHDKGLKLDRSECIVCNNCVKVCPENAVSFGFIKKDPEVDLAGVQAGRRAFVGGALGGFAAGLGMRADVLHPSESFLPLPTRHPKLVRAPGSLPEHEFLSRCLRCGECMRACLTNVIQPDWYRAGFEGLWAPYMSLRHAACEQTCNVCGQVCPTEAIRPLSLKEKQYAKIGTAVVIRDRCLPWSQDHRCLICDEQCPYNAIVFHHDSSHHVGLPVVNASKCNGCGQCEDKCPIVGEAAIQVSPEGELRLIDGSYVEEAIALGLVFEAKDKVKDQFQLDDDRLPPDPPDHPPDDLGTTKELPPGIEEDETDDKKPKLPSGIEPED
ncbi:MAG: 4Fe-4S binding protein [Deltaproteobacteria bacterium]|nr:4Fe-4S binding protein [Deltaproteobacteria bacterium]